MVDPVRVFAYSSFFGSMLAWSLLAPEHMQAVAEEPVKMVALTIDTLFPPNTVDPKMFRHYDITFDDNISTEVTRTQVIEKIGHGRTSQVTIVTTPSGTYSTDGLLSPHVLYPGIEKKSKRWGSGYWSASSRSDGSGHWSSFSNGSFTYYSYRSSTRT